MDPGEAAPLWETLSLAILYVRPTIFVQLTISILSAEVGVFLPCFNYELCYTHRRV